MYEARREAARARKRDHRSLTLEVSGKKVLLPLGWGSLAAQKRDLYQGSPVAVRNDLQVRVIVTGKHLRYTVQQKHEGTWVAVCKPGARSNSYFASILSAVEHGDRYGPPRSDLEGSE